jgi:isoquinoline 1-oxidoreductase alpha subunit
MAYTIKVNGKMQTVDVEADTPLLWVLRDTIGLVGSKFGCGAGLCGACTVHLDGAAVRSCQTQISRVGTKAVTTIEGIGANPIGLKVQTAWIDHDVIQCGYCQAGQIMSATALLTDADIDKAMQGNICRCATYTRIRSAIHQASGQTPALAAAPAPGQVLASASTATKGA